MDNELYNILVINLFLYYNNKFQRGKVDKAALEDMASCIEDLKKENENYQNKISELNNSLCFYKNLVKTEKEGLTMQFDCRRPTHVSLIFIERHIYIYGISFILVSQWPYCVIHLQTQILPTSCLPISYRFALNVNTRY